MGTNKMDNKDRSSYKFYPSDSLRQTDVLQLGAV